MRLLAVLALLVAAASAQNVAVTPNAPVSIVSRSDAAAVGAAEGLPQAGQWTPAVLDDATPRVVPRATVPYNDNMKVPSLPAALRVRAGTERTAQVTPVEDVRSFIDEEESLSEAAADVDALVELNAEVRPCSADALVCGGE